VTLVFLGTPQAAVPSLLALEEAGHRIGLVVTQPDRPIGRSRKPVAPPVKQTAERLGLEVIQPRKVRNAAFAQALAEVEPDCLAVVAYGRILPPAVLEVPRLGPINLHFSLLPRYRGAAPVQWALARGEQVTGVTTMRINERMDEGDLFLQRAVPIEANEHAPALEQRLATIGAALLVDTLDALERRTIEPQPQDHDAATLAPLLSRADGDVDPELTAAEIVGRVRGFDPWPGAWLLRGQRRLRVATALALDGPPLTEPPGTLVRCTAEGVLMACGGGSGLLVSRVQPEGGRVMAVRDAINGRLLGVGDRLERPPATH
jgi:methionyl-tRNA formyltransferase